MAVYGNVLPHEGGGFRIWYHAGAKGHQSDKVLCYAESDDGFNWKRIMVSNEPYGGVSPTNIVLGPNPTVAVPCVIENRHSDDPNERFLLMFNSYVRDYPELADVMQGAKRWCFVATSPNGIAWLPPKGRLTIPGKADCPISIVWDEINRRYIAYLRGNRKPQPFDPNQWGPNAESAHVRYVRASVSRDFKHWSDPIEILRCDEGDNDPFGQIQQMAVTRRGGQFIGLLSLMNVLKYHWIEEHNLLMEEAATDTQLIVSRDGFHWDRVADRQTFLPLGAPNQWDSAWIVTQHSIVYDGDRMLFFYDATNKGRGDMPAWNKKSPRTSNFRIGVAQLPRDRFQALRPQKLHLDGVIETKPLNFVENGDLKLNADTSRGRIEVELCDYDGQSIDGFTRSDCCSIEGVSDLQIPVRWNGRSIAQARDNTIARPSYIRVRFYLRQASLFAVEFPVEHPWPVPRDYGTTSDLEHMSPNA